MTAKHLAYKDYDREASLSCPDCGWSGRGANIEDCFKELLDVKCPRCDRMLLIVSFPTNEATNTD